MFSRNNISRGREVLGQAPTLFFCIGAFLLLRFCLLIQLNIHWDEFFFLSRVFDLQSGSLSGLFQTFHSWLFLPLTYLPFEETGLVLSGRMISFALFLATLCLLYGMLSQAFGLVPSVLALLIWGSCPESMIHGGSFRADSLCLFLVVLALSLCRSEAVSRKAVAVSGISLAVAFAVSLKSILLLAVFAPFAFRSSECLFSPKRIQSLFLILNVCLVSLFFLLVFHSSFVIQREDIALGRESTGALSYAAKLSREFLTLHAASNTVTTVGASMTMSPSYWILLISLVVFAARPNSRVPAFIWCSIGIAFSVCLFYRNIFAYFLPTVVFPWSVLAALEGGRLMSRGRYLGILVPVAFAVCAAFTFERWREFTMSGQREFIAAIHEAFPEPVAYIDRCGMVSSFPKVGPFLSSLVVERYRAGGNPIFPELVASLKPHFLIENSPLLEGRQNSFGSTELLDADRAELNSAFPYRYGKLRSRLPIPAERGEHISRLSRFPLFAPY